MSQGDATSKSPRYQQLGDLLRRKIVDGVYAVGDFLPTENELCSEFSVSRYTVREALRQLINAGLVKRRQGSGTQVVASQVQGNYVHSMRSLSELFQYAADTVFRIYAHDTHHLDAELAAYVGEEGDKPWLQVSGVRLGHEGEAPICHSTVLIHPAFANVADSLEQHEGAIYSLIEQRYGVAVADVVQEISAAPITRVAAARLATSSRIWAVRVIRRYLSADGKVLLISINDHPGDRFSYTMHLRREGSRGWSGV
ncbi:GntR family transcriptional regulator [Mesorhizobium sp. CN2-181]|uniref:GntR family transcriptional regulator n=1 Tax=Mesorhizobium yinganensis TaxID=3157707 RepID=UPI0032B7CF9F